MARQNIELGTPPSGVGGDTPRTAFTKVNDMATEVYSFLGASSGSLSAPAARTALGVDVTLATAILDPQTSGGLMSATVVSGWTIEKFANGTCIVAGAFTSASLTANSQTAIDTTIPSVLVGETVAGVCAAALPTASIDVGAVNAFMVGNTVVRLYARNGATAQAILFRIKIIGRWK